MQFTIHPNSPQKGPSRYTRGSNISDTSRIPEELNNIDISAVFEEPLSLNDLDASGKNALHRAIENCDINDVKNLIDLKVDINAKDKDGNSPFHIIIDKYIDAENTQAKLLQNREEAKVARDGRQFFIFENALVQNNKYISDLRMMFKVFCLKGADLNILNSNGETILHKCIHVANNNLLRLILGFGADVRAADSMGITPLMLAILLNCKSTAEHPKTCISFLMEADMDIIYQTKNGNEYIEQIQKYFISAADELFSWEEPLHLLSSYQKRFSNLIEVEKKSPLMISIERENVPIVQFLLRKDALRAELAMFGRKPLHLKKMTTNEEIIKLITKYSK